MKKIFAIALALVMVLSMASAFAMTCTNINWACNTTTYNCGTATVEVVPYVVANACDGKAVEYVQSNCAAAVYNEKVYYAVKINVPADINEEWWADAELSVKLTGLTGTEVTGMSGLVAQIKADKDFGKKALTYYLDDAATVISADADAFELKNVMWFATVSNAKTAKVCATLTSKVDPVAEGNYVEVGEYKIRWVGGNIWVWNGKEGADKKEAIFSINSKDLIENVVYNYGTSSETFVDFGFIKADGTASGYCAPYDWLKAVMEYFKLDFRATCFTEKAFKANFGWDNEVKSCFTYSSNASAVVDAECVVAIPKTGDASVLAWLF